MLVLMKQAVRMLGTDVTIPEGEVCHAEPATNQPDFQEKGLYFVYSNESRHSDSPILCTLNEEFAPLDSDMGQIRFIDKVLHPKN